MAEKTVTIPEKEYKALVADGEENKLMIADLIAKVEDLNSATLAGAGVDPQAAARRSLGTELVQFTKHYSKAAIPSETQKGVNTHEAYSVECGDIVHLKVDEIERIQKDFPELLLVGEKNFKVKMRFKPELGLDDNKRPVTKMVEDPLDVETLIEIAETVG